MLNEKKLLIINNIILKKGIKFPKFIKRLVQRVSTGGKGLKAK